jgi:hypothetical protein
MNLGYQHRELPRYGIREDEMTKPCVVLYDWNAEEKTVRIDGSQLDVGKERDEADDYADLFRPKWHGIGRRAGSAILGTVLGLCVAIGLFALVESSGESGQTGALVEVPQR